MPIDYGAGYVEPLAAGVYPEPDNTPPRVVIAVSAPGDTTVTVYRQDPSGETLVRGALDAPLDAQGAAVFYDYECALDVPLVYTVSTA